MTNLENWERGIFSSSKLSKSWNQPISVWPYLVLNLLDFQTIITYWTYGLVLPIELLDRPWNQLERLFSKIWFVFHIRPAQVHHNVSLQALVAVIQCAAQKKRLVRNSIAGMGRPNRLIQSAARNRNIGTSKSGRTTANNNRPKTETKPSDNAKPTTPLATNSLFHLHWLKLIIN